MKYKYRTVDVFFTHNLRLAIRDLKSKYKRYKTYVKKTDGIVKFNCSKIKEFMVIGYNLNNQRSKEYKVYLNYYKVLKS